MTENEVLAMILDIKEIQVDRFEVQDRSLHIHCSSIFEEAICPSCLKKRQVVNQTYVRQFRDLPIAGKEVYLHLSQRQFYCLDCARHFNERFSFVDPKRTMTRRYERHVYECCKASTIQKISAQENLVWQTVNEVCQRGARQELEERPVSKVRVVGMDEFAIKKGHRDYATVIVDLERVEIIDILEYRDQEKLIEYFKNRGAGWCEGIEVFCSDMWQGFSIRPKRYCKCSLTAGKVDSGRDRPTNQLREGRDMVQAGHPIFEVRPEGDALFAAGLLEAGEGVAASSPVRAAGAGADVAFLHHIAQVGLAAVVVDRQVGALQHPE